MNSGDSEENSDRIKGSFALSHVSYVLSDRCIVYPIKLERYFGQDVIRFAEQKVRNIFDKVPTVIQEVSKDGAGISTYKALVSGELATTYASSESLLLMIPQMYQIADAPLPCVFHIASQRVNLKNQIVEDHTNVMAVRQTGFAILSSHSAKECHDMAIIAHVSSLKSSIPFLHFFDGIHETTSRDGLLSHEKLAELIYHSDIDSFRSSALNQLKTEIVEEELYFQPSKITVQKYTEANHIVETVMNELAPVLGTRYRPFEYVGDEDAESVVIVIGSAAKTMELAVQQGIYQKNGGIGIIKIRLYRPWSVEAFRQVLPQSVKRIAVLDRSEEAASGNEPLYLDVTSALCSNDDQDSEKYTNVEIFSGRYADTLSTFDTARVHTFLSDLANKKLSQRFVLTSQSIPETSRLVVPPVVVESLSTISVEQPYIKLLNQLFPLRALITNLIGSSTIWGGKVGEEDKNMKGNAEYGFGMHLAHMQLRKSLEEKVKSLLACPSTQLSQRLESCMMQWLRDPTPVTSQEMANVLEHEHTSSDVLRELYAKRKYFPKSSQWIIGNDEWADDIGASGIHHVIASGENVNVIILDTEPYSRIIHEYETNSRRRNKKDIGLYAMNYGNSYVASVALYDSYSQVVRTLAEADAFPGPSIILVYAPADENGALTGISAESETQKAIKSGYWPLYRWNPLLEKNGEKAFALYSETIKDELKKFLIKENQLTILSKEAPSFKEPFTRSIEGYISNEHKKKLALVSSFDKLNGALSENSLPLLILYGSDNGNAEGFAFRFEEEGKRRGLHIRVSAMNDYAVEDLPTESHVLFVVSTAGQGEMPANAKEFFHSLTMEIKDTSYAVFGLGDSNYWPREEEKHYFCKAAKDLDVRLEQLGGMRLAPVALGDDQDEDGPSTAYESWKPLLWEALGVNNVGLQGDSTAKAKVTNEQIKSNSNFLRGTLHEGLADRSTGALSEADTQLTKFHGIYQQDNRDLRAERSAQKLEKAYSFMIRVRVPGGISTAAQYIAMDDLCDKYANGNIKLTTRQAYQLQAILKWDLKDTVKGINKALMDSLAACGDVNRNVMANPNPDQSSVHREVWEVSKEISAHLSPRTSAYHEIWLDKKLVAGGEAKDFEPLYGETYLPRKFKIAIAIPPSNDVDVYAHCLGFIAIIENQQLIGFNVTVGGGMGMTHNNKATYPRLADVMGFCTVEQAKHVAEKVMLVQRDYGDRKNRKHARFKYTVEDHGLDWIREQVEERLGYKLGKARPFRFESNGDRFGWTPALDGKSHYTLYIEGGRIRDTDGYKLKTALRKIAELHKGDFRLTPNQNLIIGNIDAEQRSQIESILKEYNIDNNRYSALRLNSIACAALPFCGLALAEAERYLPSLITRLEQVITDSGLWEDAIVIRMTGCPNGCGRPYLGEIGFVGRAPGIYNLYLGAGFGGERLNKLYREALNEDQLIEALTPIIQRYALERQKNEKFGDFVIRCGYVKACDARPLIELRAPGETFHD